MVANFSARLAQAKLTTKADFDEENILKMN